MNMPPSPMLAITPSRSEPVRYDSVSGVSLELLPACPYTARYTPSSPMIGFAFDPQQGVHALGSDRRCDFERPAYSLALLPSGCDVFSESACGGEYLSVSLSPAQLASIERSTENLSSWTQPIGPKVAADVISTARTLRYCLLTGHSLQDTLVERLLENSLQALLSVSNDRRETNTHVFSRGQLHLLDDYIDAHLDQPLTVNDMAAVLHVSAGHFARMFKASTGVSPFDDIIHRRLSRARRALCDSYINPGSSAKPDNDLSSIAFACGFSSHAHMSMAFKKYLGVTPSQLRACSR